MKINLQERHLCFVAYELSQQLVGSYIKILNTIRDSLNGANYQPTDLVEIDVDKTEIVVLYFELGNKPEYFTAKINKEMKNLLLPQFVNKIENYYALLAANGVDVFSQLEINNMTESDRVVLNEGIDAEYIINEIRHRDEKVQIDIETLINYGRNLLS